MRASKSVRALQQCEIATLDVQRAVGEGWGSGNEEGGMLSRSTSLAQHHEDG